jgi:hypothetical protein
MIASRFERPIVIRFLTANPGPLPTGTVREIGGIDEMRRSPGILAADIYFELGETIRPVQVDADRRGYIIATSLSAGAALTAADAAASKLDITVDAQPEA